MSCIPYKPNRWLAEISKLRVKNILYRHFPSIDYVGEILSIGDTVLLGGAYIGNLENLEAVPIEEVRTVDIDGCIDFYVEFGNSTNDIEFINDLAIKASESILKESEDRHLSGRSIVYELINLKTVDSHLSGSFIYGIV